MKKYYQQYTNNYNKPAEPIISGLALLILKETLKKGETIEIPSLDITIKSEDYFKNS